MSEQTRDPRTNEEWQEAVDEADFYLHLDASVKYGMVSYTGQINVGRCEEILTRGRAVGVTPSPDSVERVFRRLTRPTAREITGGE